MIRFTVNINLILKQVGMKNLFALVILTFGILTACVPAVNAAVSDSPPESAQLIKAQDVGTVSVHLVVPVAIGLEAECFTLVYLSGDEPTANPSATTLNDVYCDAERCVPWKNRTGGLNGNHSVELTRHYAWISSYRPGDYYSYRHSRRHANKALTPSYHPRSPLPIPVA